MKNGYVNGLDYYDKLYRRADAIEDMRREHLRKLSVQAGLCPNLLGIHPHNAWAAYEHGRPWKGVDYSIVRRIIRLQMRPTAISVVNKLFSRKELGHYE